MSLAAANNRVTLSPAPSLFLPQVKGTLMLNATHIIFVEDKTRYETWTLYMVVHNVKKKAVGSTGSLLLTINCKNFQALQYIIPRLVVCVFVWLSIRDGGFAREDECKPLYAAALKLVHRMSTPRLMPHVLCCEHLIFRSVHGVTSLHQGKLMQCTFSIPSNILVSQKSCKICMHSSTVQITTNKLTGGSFMM